MNTSMHKIATAAAAAADGGNNSQIQSCGETAAATTTATVEHEYDSWVDDTVISIANACTLCGSYDMQQMGFELQQQQQTRKQWSSQDLEISIYQKFLFDESSIRLDE